MPATSQFFCASIVDFVIGSLFCREHEEVEDELEDEEEEEEETTSISSVAGRNEYATTRQRPPVGIQSRLLENIPIYNHNTDF